MVRSSRKIRSHDAKEKYGGTPAVLKTTWISEGLILSQRARGVMYKSFTPEL